MGTALADVFRRNGCRVVTSVHNRSERTKRLVQDAGIETLPSVQDVVRESSILLSTTPPQCAVDVAKEIVGMAPCEGTLFVDANSVAPRTIQAVEHLVSTAGLQMVDMAIRGLAGSLLQRGAIYLSGHEAARVEPLLYPIETEHLGAEVGSASRLKMLMGGLSKGIATLVMELGVGAERAGILDRFLEGLQRYYPDVSSAMDSVLPTYPLHAGRRAHELQEVISCLADSGVESQVVAGGSRLLEEYSRTELEKASAALRAASVRENVKALAKQSSFLSSSTRPRFVDSL